MTEKFRKPRSFNASQLSRAGVVLVDADTVHLRCKTCGQNWQPQLLAGGKLPKRYWQCPNNCNQDAE
jgi:hypothetical protein